LAPVIASFMSFITYIASMSKGSQD